ncbi:multidrug efflux RND transporter permease subunit MexW [Pseudomonas aeruginosa]|uniref:multidrug efflux RND transporter permease subunit MexW n=1 Tax=Pseudomonas aeruginosa TaxID=287 RepID=UPI00021200E2|nr:multidrug efflux RND transporter permease subunit MexW [Pseudomonas aeruginosa]EKU9160872.1 multidrug efflux RND transporter permease subunit MexW [Pseudomonas aeruginosa]ELH4227292.1 multidrug efflux RND transporter permease subunit MexW [Pseudomonas aeruginosa]EME94005.1 multidrug efflux protein [Pseudomonas aeruginosa PA21_ST175]ERF05077.1 acriflavine resistance protein B [Pseudomonas aeruginosa HB13]KSD30416.1 multidrug efflux protein [Pseudomonas aeruginosa]
MAFTDPFIRRPVLASVVSLLIVLLGMQAFSKLVIREYPQMENALITVTTLYAGANAETIQGYITQPLQQSLASAEGIDYMTSVSRQNYSTISIYARIGANTDRLVTELLAKSNEVKSQLPPDAEDPVLQKEAADASALMYISFYSEQMNNPQITDYLSRVIQPKLATLPGIAEAEILGNQVFAMRLWLDPVKMAAFGVTAGEINQAVQQYNFLAAAGEVKGQLVVTSVNASTDLKSPQAFAAIPVKTDGDRRVLMGDVARVELGAASYDAISSFNGIPSVYIGIKGTPSANPLDVIKEVRAKMPELEEQLPPNLKVSIAYDATRFIQASIDEVVKTLGEAVLIVIVVVFLFLGAFRSVLIPVVTIPLSMIGVLFFMQAMGYSINLLTLLAMVLAIGLVVDDAIVVVENIHRHIEEGKPPFEAALEGAREIAVPVVSMTITLAAVYAPIGFLTGLTGALFKEFAFTLAGAVIISGIVALTLSPMMCSRLLRHEENPSGLAHRLDLIFEGLKRRYQRALHGTLDTRPVVLVFAVLVLALIPVLLMFTKKELAPEEDQGIVFLMTNSPQTANLDYLNRYTAEFEGIFRSFPEYYSAFQINGYNGVQAGIGGMLLKPWDEREKSQMELLHAVQAKLNEIPGVQIFAFNLPSLPGTGEGLPFQFVLNTANDYESLLQVAQRVKQRASESGKFAFLDLDLAFDKPELVVDIDREKAAQMGVSMQDLGVALASLLGEGEINRFTIDGRSYKVIAQVERPYRDNPGWLGSYYVKSRNGQLVALSTLIETHERARPRQLNQFQQLNSAIISGFPIVSMGEAIETVQQIAREEAPRGFAVDYAGASRQYVQEGSALLVTFGLALAIIFLVLAAQFESFRDPLVIMVTVPLSICGALIPLFLGVSSLNIYTQVGLVTLIGLISKHGILIVEFANQLRHEQELGRREAIEQAAAIRLRPVLMTTAAMVLGVIPLILATGAGAVSRFDIGIVIATGMSVGTLFTLFVLPCIYTLVARPDAPPGVTQAANAH